MERVASGYWCGQLASCWSYSPGQGRQAEEQAVGRQWSTWEDQFSHRMCLSACHMGTTGDGLNKSYFLFLMASDLWCPGGTFCWHNSYPGPSALMGVDGCHSRQRVRPKKRKCFQKGNPVIHMSIFPRHSLQGTAMWEPGRTQDLDPCFWKEPFVWILWASGLGRDEG